jgi:citrate lyase gamma subunit
MSTPDTTIIGDSQHKPNDYPPSYWVKAFSGSPISIFVPPYIRFLQGQVALRKALAFLIAARKDAIAGNPQLQKLYESIEASSESKQAEITFETFFAATILINLVSEVEHFFGSAIATALRMYPGKMGNQTFKLTEIITASSNNELIDRAASATLNELMYEKPMDYLTGLAEILSINKESMIDVWPGFVEVKARRDLGVHNNWVANPIYLRKLKEAKCKDLPNIGTRLIPDFAYLNEALSICDKLVELMANLMAEKWLPIVKTNEASEGHD